MGEGNRVGRKGQREWKGAAGDIGTRGTEKGRQLDTVNPVGMRKRRQAFGQLGPVGHWQMLHLKWMRNMALTLQAQSLHAELHMAMQKACAH
eukprot:1159047-Pelagomonas_calceolata.AAC.7